MPLDEVHELTQQPTRRQLREEAAAREMVEQAELASARVAEGIGEAAIEGIPTEPSDYIPKQLGYDEKIRQIEENDPMFLSPDALTTGSIPIILSQDTHTVNVPVHLTDRKAINEKEHDLNPDDDGSLLEDDDSGRVEAQENAVTFAPKGAENSVGMRERYEAADGIRGKKLVKDPTKGPVEIPNAPVRKVETVVASIEEGQSEKIPVPATMTRRELRALLERHRGLSIDEVLLKLQDDETSDDGLTQLEDLMSDTEDTKVRNPHIDEGAEPGRKIQMTRREWRAHQAPQEVERHPETRRERKELEQAAQSWWKKAAKSIRERAGLRYWKIHYAAKDVLQDMLYYGIDREGLLNDEVEQKMEKRRKHVMAAGAVILGGLLVRNGVDLISHGVAALDPSAHAAGGVGLGEHSDWTQHRGTGNIVVPETTTSSDASETIKTTITSDIQPGDITYAYEPVVIHKGEGMLEAIQHANPSMSYEQAVDLWRTHGGAFIEGHVGEGGLFYQSNPNNLMTVGINDAGELPADLQDKFNQYFRQ